MSKTPAQKSIRYSLKEGFLWIFLFVALQCLMFLFTILDPPEEYRGWLFEFGVLLGFLSMGFFISQFITTGRFSKVASNYGSDILLHFHKYTGVAAALFFIAHPIVIISADFTFIKYFNPFDDFFRAVALISATIFVISIIFTSIFGLPKWLNYEYWRLTHTFLAAGIVFIGMVHGLQVGHYLNAIWKQAIWIGLALLALYSIFYVRILRPWQMKKHPYEIDEVIEERGNAYTLKLKPVGHQGLPFKAGQFAWITVGDSPYSLQQNPFSIASGEQSQYLKFTAQVVGDFTRKWKSFKKGTPVWVDMPYGSFTITDAQKGLYFLAAGSGIVPVMSILRTMRANEDGRKITLLYGSPSLSEALFYDELESLKEFLNLKVIHILENPPYDWDQEQGFLTKSLIEKHLPNDTFRYSYYCCGPKPFLDKSELWLREMGVDWRRIIPERFTII